MESDHGTTHLSALDQSGMAVGITSSVNSVFGSHLLDSETGVLLNNGMDDFSRPHIKNEWGLLPSPCSFILSPFPSLR